MKNLHALPTTPNDETANGIWIKETRDWCNIYITNDEEIKEGDWIFETDSNTINIAGSDYVENKLDFKIILTTDQDLIKDGVQAIHDDFLEWFVSKANDSGVPIDIVDVISIMPKGYKIIIPKEEITFEEVFGEEKKKGLKEFIDKHKQKQHLIDMMEKDEELGLYDYGWCKGNVILPKEYPGEYDETQAKQVLQLANNLKQETLEEAAENFSKNYSIYDSAKDDTEYGFINGAKWQQEQNNTANEILDYILTNDDGVGIALGYNSREMIEQYFKNIGYERNT